MEGVTTWLVCCFGCVADTLLDKMTGVLVVTSATNSAAMACPTSACSPLLGRMACVQGVCSWCRSFTADRNSAASSLYMGHSLPSSCQSLLLFKSCHCSNYFIFFFFTFLQAYLVSIFRTALSCCPRPQKSMVKVKLLLKAWGRFLLASFLARKPSDLRWV